jgi:hypothetical protein
VMAIPSDHIQRPLLLMELIAIVVEN